MKSDYLAKMEPGGLGRGRESRGKRRSRKPLACTVYIYERIVFLLDILHFFTITFSFSPPE